MKLPTHIAYEKGCDGRTSDKYRREVFIRETKNFWITAKGTKYDKSYGKTLGDWPMYRIVLESIKSLPTHTATLLKNEKVDNPNVKDEFIKHVHLWKDEDAYISMSTNSYGKDGYPIRLDGCPIRLDNPVKLDITTIKPFVLTKTK